MQGVQNIPNPDTDSLDIEDDFDSHSDYPDIDRVDSENPNVSVPPDKEQGAPVEEPPSNPNVETPPVGEDRDEPKQIV